MNFNLFSIIAASAISATVALPASANAEISDKKPTPRATPRNTCNKVPTSTPHWTTKLKPESSTPTLCRSEVTCVDRVERLEPHE